MKVGIYIVALVIFLVVRLIIKVAKTTNNTPPPRQNPNPYNNPPMKQPPPYVPPSQQTMDDLNDFLKTQDSSFNQRPNIFNTSPPPFSGTQSPVPNMSSRNTNSNMSPNVQSYYCMYCGKRFQSTAALRMDTCFKHPKADQGLQKHVLYTGMGKPNIAF